MAETLLLVEDEDGVRESLAEYLAMQGYTLFLASGEPEAWDLAQAHKPRIVISDLNLDKGTGLSLLRRLKQDPPSGVDPFCVLITGYGTLDSVVEALRAGVDDLLTKPFSLQDLQASLDKAPSPRNGSALAHADTLSRLDHELAAPLSHLAAYLDMMEQGLFGPLGLVQGAKLASMQLGLRRALLALSSARLQSGDSLHRNRPERLQAEGLFRLVFNEFNLDFERRGVSVEQIVPLDLPAVLVDRHAAYLAFEAVLAGTLLRTCPGQTLRLAWSCTAQALQFDLRVDGMEGPDDGLWQDLPQLHAGWLEQAGLSLDAVQPGRCCLRFLQPRDDDA